MLKNIKSFLKKIESSKEYESWKHSHKNSYLCSAFMIGNDLENQNWQLDFYDQDKELMTSFTETKDIINLKEEKIFKKPESEIKELNLSKVKIDLNDAILAIEELMKEKFPGENPSQRIFVLQTLDVLIWNITYINTSFNILNVKIDAITGSIIDDSLTSVLGFKDKKYDKSAIDKMFK